MACRSKLDSKERRGVLVKKQRTSLQLRARATSYFAHVTFSALTTVLFFNNNVLTQGLLFAARWYKVCQTFYRAQSKEFQDQLRPCDSIQNQVRRGFLLFYVAKAKQRRIQVASEKMQSLVGVSLTSASSKRELKIPRSTLGLFFPCRTKIPTDPADGTMTSTTQFKNPTHLLLSAQDISIPHTQRYPIRENWHGHRGIIENTDTSVPVQMANPERPRLLLSALEI